MSGNQNKKVNPNTLTKYVDIPPATIIQHSPLFALPTDLLKPMADNKQSTSIISVGSEADEAEIMGKLSQTCKSSYHFFKPELDKRAAKKLLVSVLQGPIQGNVDHEAAIVEMAKTHPHLFFIKATAQDNAMDLEGNRRTIKDWSSYQALFGTGNSSLLVQVKPHLDAYLQRLPNSDELACQQEQEKFPNGFDFPPSTDEFNQVLHVLARTITDDQQLRQGWRNPNSVTLAALKQYRQTSKPSVVETGHHYNMNNIIKVYKIYRHWNQWNKDQLAFFSVNVIGFEERLMTEFYLRVACRGFTYHVEEPLSQNFEIMNYTKSPIGNIFVVPFASENPSCRLGADFVIDSYDGGRALTGIGSVSRCNTRNFWETTLSKNNRTFKTYAHAKETSSITLHDGLRR